MGAGIEAARLLSPEAAAAIENMRDDLLLIFLKRLGGKLTIPCEEIDSAGDYVLLFGVDPMTRAFTFELQKKD